MPIIGLDRMPGAGLARGTLFDKELNVTEIDVPDLTIRSSLILEKTGENAYNIIWTSPSGDDRDLSIPSVGANDSFILAAATQTLTNKALGTGTTITAGTIRGITDLEVASATSTTLFGDLADKTLVLGEGASTISIPGNLTISGTTTTIDTSNLVTSDNIIYLNQDYSISSPTQDSGFLINRGGTQANVAMMWDESEDEFVMATTTTAHTQNTLTPATYANLHVGALTLKDNEATALVIKEAGNAYLTFNTADSGGSKIVANVELEGSNFDIDGGDVSAIVISGGLTWNAAQNLNSQALTGVNIDTGDIATAVVINKSPDITLTGDVTGSGTMTSLGNVSFATTIASDSVALGTDTTGNYVATIAGTSNEIEVSGSGSENAGITLGIPDNPTLPGNVTIGGNLTVNGSTTTVNTATLSVEDPLISLAIGNNAADSVDIGIYGLYDTSGSQDLYGGFFRDASDGKWKLFKDSQEALGSSPTATTINVSATGYAVASLIANLEGAVTGNADTATALATARQIGGTSFNGTADIAVALATNATNVIAAANSTNENQFIAFLNNSNTTAQPVLYDTGLVYNPSSNTLQVDNFTGALAGNASTATALATARNIGGVSFDGTAAINLPGVNTAGNQNTSGTAAIATTVTVADTNDTTAFVGLFDSATGNLGAKTDAAMTYNAGTATLYVTNMNVSGTTTTTNTTITSTTDSMFKYASGNDADATDFGFYGLYVDSGSKYAGLFRDASDSDKWKLFATTGNSNAEPTGTVSTASGFTLGTLAVASLEGTIATAAQNSITSASTLATVGAFSKWYYSIWFWNN